MLYTSPLDFYSLLQIPQDASPYDIKVAYHRTLLRLHPDKLPARMRHHNDVASRAHLTTGTGQSPLREIEEDGGALVDMALLKEAYRTLSDAGLRTTYDAMMRREIHARSRGPRPAQVVSLEEFTPVEAAESPIAGSGSKIIFNVQQEWRYECRCGGAYHITEHDLEYGIHLVGCESCSEVIWVGYEEVAIESESKDT